MRAESAQRKARDFQCGLSRSQRRPQRRPRRTIRTVVFRPMRIRVRVVIRMRICSFFLARAWCGTNETEKRARSIRKTALSVPACLAVPQSYKSPLPG